MNTTCSDDSSPNEAHKCALPMLADPQHFCELSGISNKQIYRKIKQLTGMSPVEYIKSIRMKKAAMLLQQKKFTVAEVMYMVGFSNHSYFSKCFQAEFGKTPKQYMQPAVDEENHNK